MMQEIIKIPSNFHELSNVNALFNTVEFVDHIKESINNYSIAFVESFLMNASEVLEYIPECDKEIYTIPLFHYALDDHYRNRSLDGKLNLILHNSDEKIFFVDTKKKEINIGWFNGIDVSKIMYLPFERTNLSYMNFKYYGQTHIITYDKDNKEVIITNNAFISKREDYNKYASTYYEMQMNNQIDHYKINIMNRFCVQSNTYLGCKTNSEFTHHTSSYMDQLESPHRRIRY